MYSTPAARRLPPSPPRQDDDTRTVEFDGEESEQDTEDRHSVYSLNSITTLDEVDGVTEKTKFHLRSLCSELRELQLDNSTVPHTLLSIALDEMNNNTD